ncbi:M56 family metallopeptidase [Spirosoma soli]|uniref:M56 family metallopeptidase n=2 Tax=Spirosoma soli TaxID=1770529 RepID=A0ABW5M5V7_9BACT
MDFLNSPVAYALGWTLLHAVWQGFLLVLPTALVFQVLRSQSSELRYHIGVLTLLTQVIVSVGTFIWYYSTTTTPVNPTPAATFIQPALAVQWRALSQTLSWSAQTEQFLESHIGHFVLAYLIGVALFGLRLVGGWLYLQRISRTATEPATKMWSDVTEVLRSSLAIQKVIRLRESARIAVPMVVGVVQPVLLLPLGLATSLSIREIEVILAHELAHIKRHDYAVNLLQSVVEVLYFFHPALWWLSARVREEREHCCDDLAVQACGGDGRILAQALAHVEELRLAQVYQTPILAMAFATKRPQLLHRVRRILGVSTRPVTSNARLAGLTLATLLLISVSVYAIQKQDSPKPKVTKTQSSRRHKAGNGTEFIIVDNHKVENVIWKGKRLSTTRVNRLQRQLDQVMAGQLSLDQVPQADRDILLTIIETNHSFGEGMDGLKKGSGHINDKNIAVSALGIDPSKFNERVEGLAKIALNTMSDASPSLGHPVANQDLSISELDSLPKGEPIVTRLSELWTEDMRLKSHIKQLEQTLENSIAEMKEPQRERRGLEEEQENLKKQVFFMRNQLKNPALAPVKSVLSNEVHITEIKIRELGHRIEDINRSKIRPYIGSLENIFPQLRFVKDSIRATEEKIIELSKEIGITRVEDIKPIVPIVPPLPEAPRPPKPLKGKVKLARPAAPASADVPLPPSPAIAPTPSIQPAPAAPSLPPAPAAIAPATPSVPVRPLTPRPAPTPKVAPVPKPDK